MTLSKNTKDFKYVRAYWDHFTTEIKRPVTTTAFTYSTIVTEIINLQVVSLGAIMKCGGTQ